MFITMLNNKYIGKEYVSMNTYSGLKVDILFLPGVVLKINRLLALHTSCILCFIQAIGLQYKIRLDPDRLSVRC